MVSTNLSTLWGGCLLNSLWFSICHIHTCNAVVSTAMMSLRNGTFDLFADSTFTQVRLNVGLLLVVLLLLILK